MIRRVLVGMAILVLTLAACDLDSGGLSNAEKRTRKGARQAQREIREAERETRQQERGERTERRRDRREESREAAGTVEEEVNSNCTPGYSVCLPPAADYDCAGGTGDGPESMRRDP